MDPAIKLPLAARVYIKQESDDDDDDDEMSDSNSPARKSAPLRSTGPRAYKHFVDLADASKKERVTSVRMLEALWPGKPIAMYLPSEFYPAVRLSKDGTLSRAKLSDPEPKEILTDTIDWPSNMLQRLRDVANLTREKPEEAVSYLLRVVQERRRTRAHKDFEMGLTGADCANACRMIRRARGEDEDLDGPRARKRAKLQQKTRQRMSESAGPAPYPSPLRDVPHSSRADTEDDAALASESAMPSPPPGDSSEMEQLRLELKITQLKLKMLKAQGRR